MISLLQESYDLETSDLSKGVIKLKNVSSAQFFRQMTDKSFGFVIMRLDWPRLALSHEIISAF